jgi:hypothetical protein
MIFAIHTGEEIQPLFHSGEHRVLGDHGIPDEPRDEEKIAMEILGIVVEILTDDLAIRVR